MGWYINPENESKESFETNMYLSSFAAWCGQEEKGTK